MIPATARRSGSAALLLVLTAISCSQPAPEEVESETAVPVKTAPATTGSITGVIHATGTVAPAPGAELIVSAPEAARIAEIPAAEGDRVRRGDLLVRFDIPSLPAEVEKQAAEVQRAQASLENARANQARARDLFQRGVAARKEVEDADRQIADAEAAVAQAQASRNAAASVASRAVARATFDGVVAKRSHNPGDFVEPSAGDPVLRVVDLGRLEVVAAVPLADVARLRVGAAAHLSSVPAGRDEMAFKVVSRPAAVDPGSASVPVRLAPAGRIDLPVNTPVAVDIAAEEHPNAILVSASAIVREGEETAVFVANGEKAERRKVEAGISDGKMTEIVSGVKAGELVIVDGQTGLPDGAAIHPEPATDDAK